MLIYETHLNCVSIYYWIILNLLLLNVFVFVLTVYTSVHVL